MEIVTKKINDLIAYDSNPRIHTPEQVVQISESIKEFGWTMPILIDEHNEIIAGHGRLLAGKKLGIEDVPCIVATDWSVEQKKAYCIADNKLTENSEWDTSFLKLNLTYLVDNDFNVLKTGFDTKELSKLLPEFGLSQGLTDEDDIPSTPTNPKTKLGDVWILGQHRLMCGDSRSKKDIDLLMNGKKADLVFTDPPYGIDYSGGRTQVVATKDYGKIKNDNLPDIDTGELLSQMFNYAKLGADFYICVSPINQKPFLDFLDRHNKTVDAVIVWDKKNAGLGYMAYRRRCEFILFIKGKPFKKGDRSDFDVWEINRDATTEYKHGTQKPVKLSQRAIENSSKADDIVLDLFIGSGSSLIGCESTKRVCYGIELDEKFCDVAIKRWQNYTGKKAINERSGKAFD